ncbi:MAG: hypothetical protein JM58_06000 [Peptococcaceae bacterium BICA1-8]|nr:MAG: hypothetical protein JM58_06000 [Peptococcaceae bacterium BICA1-8]
MDNLGKEMTFWSLINEYSICIPIIQRDYVQGRNKDQVIDARRNLLCEMRTAIENDGSLDLNFIYGKVHDHDGKKVFIPLDGQQRLTTLFLLHWFSFAQAHDFSKAYVLQRFSYETRTSSRKFIEQLVRNTELLNHAVIDSEQKISDQIRNEAWFWVEWSYDPTVESMLLMLDEIKDRFSDVPDLSVRLESGTNISFRFLDMLDLGMEDSLYIKLNARGRPLTDFESFKAELFKYVKHAANLGLLDQTIAQNFAGKLDGKWTDMFWMWTKDNKENFDKLYMNCFHWMLWNRWAETQKQIEKSNYVITSAMNRTAYYRLNSYKDHGAIDGKILEDLYYTLEYFSLQVTAANSSCSVSNIKGLKYLRKCSLASGAAATYEDRVMLSAITTYISKYKGVGDPKTLGDWLRVFGNLARNSRLDGLDDYIRAVQTIAALSNHCFDLLYYLASPECTFGGFLNEQIEEERLKAKLILRDCEWADAIYTAEKHPYFTGQIAFLLNFAKLDMQNVDDLNDNELKERLKCFESYKAKVDALFNDKGLTVDAQFFSRAVLSKGDYLLAYRRCKSFLIGSHRDISWKTLMRNSNSEKREYFKEVLDELDKHNLSTANIQKCLKEIIERSCVNDWRQYFVKMEGLLEKCGYYRLIYTSPEGRILLVSCQTTAGYNIEYYTYVIHLKLLLQGRSSRYSPDRGQYGEMFIDQIDGKDIRVNYKQNENDNLWKFQIDYNCNQRTEDSVKDVIKYILQI